MIQINIPRFKIGMYGLLGITAMCSVCAQLFALRQYFTLAEFLNALLLVFGILMFSTFMLMYSIEPMMEPRRDEK